VPISPSLKISGAAPFLPTDPSRGSDPEYDDLCRAWKDLLPGLPPIDGWTITDELPDADEFGQSFIDYFEINEPPFPVHEAVDVMGYPAPGDNHRCAQLLGRCCQIVGVERDEGVAGCAGWP
jgi:hypothetical protein